MMSNQEFDKEAYKISLSSCKQKIEWLEEVNLELLKACKAAYDRLRIIPSFPEDRKATDLCRYAIRKAEGSE